MLAITTFSVTGYETYGKKMLESCIENWPGKIVVYTESPLDFKHEKIEERDFFSIPGVQTYYQYLKNIPLAHGKTPNGYNYNFDAWKFTRKVFAQYDVLKNYRGKAFWIDADCIVINPIPEVFLEDRFTVIGAETGLCFLGREGFYTETGFIGFNTEAEGFTEFLDKYIECLRRGILFTLPRWHDCEAFDWARSFQHCQENNLSTWFKIRKDGKMLLEELDVMKLSVLGPYITHNKGPRKLIAHAHS